MAGLVYEDFVPATELKHEENSETLLLHLPGFKKEQLKVQLSKGTTLRISGSRPVGDNKWERFQKEFPVSANTDTSRVTAKFEDGVLFVKQPKLITLAEKQDQTFPTPEAAPVEPDQKQPAVEPEAQKDASPDQQATEKASPVDDQEKKEEKSATNGKEARDEEEKKEEKEEEKTRLPDKLKAGLTDAAERKYEGAAAGAEDGVTKTRVPNYRDIAGAMAARFKMPRRVMNAVLVALVALLLGLYLSNLIRSFTKAEN